MRQLVTSAYNKVELTASLKRRGSKTIQRVAIFEPQLTRYPSRHERKLLLLHTLKGEGHEGVVLAFDPGRKGDFSATEGVATRGLPGLPVLVSFA